MKWIFEQYKDVPYVQLCDGYTCIDIINGECETHKNDAAGFETAKLLGGKQAPPEPDKPAKKVSKSDGN